MIIIMMGGMGASQKPIQAGQQKANELESLQSLSVLSIAQVLDQTDGETCWTQTALGWQEAPRSSPNSS